MVAGAAVFSGVHMERAPSSDPHWDLVIEIAAKLWIDGEFVAELDPTPTQRFVDLQWAARQAGRVLGGQAKVRTTSSRRSADPTVTVTVTFVDTSGRSLLCVEEGLEKLLRQVLTEESND